MIIGRDVIIDNNIKITRPHLVYIGSHVAIDWGFYCTTQLSIGDYVHVSPFVSCIGGEPTKLIVKGFNNIMAGARIICGSDRYDDSGLFGAMIPKQFKGREILGTVVLEEFSNMGTNSIILPNSILRKGALLCAGSLLIGDTEEWGVYKGNPAVLVRKINGTKMMDSAQRLLEFNGEDIDGMIIQT
jgi:acetyltransferase-like isoleucine patch superfamily enzyme